MGSQNGSTRFVVLPFVVEVVCSISCFQVHFLHGPSPLAGISSVDTGGQVHRLIRDCTVIFRSNVSLPMFQTSYRKK